MKSNKKRHVYIKVFGSNKRTLVDERYLGKVSSTKWHLYKGGYARGMVNRKLVYLHNIIMPKKDGFVVDHINNNKLDNRRSNLRYLTNHQNITRSPGWMRGKFKGVYKNTKGETWFAAITYHGIQARLGSFRSEKEAAMAYNLFAKKLFGKLCFLNKVHN